MPAITDDMVSTALQYLAQDPHPLAVAEHGLADAKNQRERIFAVQYQRQEGTVRDKECAVEIYHDYALAKDREAAAIEELARHKARVRWAETVCDMWRTSQANARAAERVR